MKLPTHTPEELRQELDDTLLDLCGDVLLLECLFFPAESKSRPNLWKCQRVRAALARRLADYVELHAKDTMSVAVALAASSTAPL